MSFHAIKYHEVSLGHRPWRPSLNPLSHPVPQPYLPTVRRRCELCVGLILASFSASALPQIARDQLIISSSRVHNDH